MIAVGDATVQQAALTVERLTQAMEQSGLIYVDSDGTPYPGLIEDTDLIDRIAECAAILSTPAPTADTGERG